MLFRIIYKIVAGHIGKLNLVLPWGVTTLIDKILRFGFMPNILRTILDRFRLVFRLLRKESLVQNRLDSLFLAGISRFVHVLGRPLRISQVRMRRSDLRLFRYQIGFQWALRLLQISVQLEVKTATRVRLSAVDDSSGILLVFAVFLSPTYLGIGSLDFFGRWCLWAFTVQMSDILILDGIFDLCFIFL